MPWQIFQQSPHVFQQTHTPLPGPLFLPSSPPILPLPPLIKGHLLSFLSASPCFSSSSLIGEFMHVSDWAELSAPPRVNSHENISPFFWGHAFFLWGRPPPLTLRLFLGAPPSLQAEEKVAGVPPGGRHVFRRAPCFLEILFCIKHNTNTRLMSLTKGLKLTWTLSYCASVRNRNRHKEAQTHFLNSVFDHPSLECHLMVKCVNCDRN